MPRFPFLLFLAAFVLGIAPLAAQTAETAPEPAEGETAALPPLTLEECVARALKHNFDLEIEAFSLAIARDAVVQSQALYDPVLDLTAGKSVARDAADSRAEAAAGGERSRSDKEDVRVGASQRLITGGAVGLSSRLNRRESSPSGFSSRNPVYDADLTVSVSQPLLRDAGLGVNRARLRRSELGLDRARFDYRSRVLLVVRDTEFAFYQLVFAREQVQVRRGSLALAEKLFSENRGRREVGSATDLDVLTAEFGVANARRNLLFAEQTLRDREDELLALIGRFEFNTPLGPASFQDVVPEAADTAASYSLARENQPDFLSTRALVEQLKLDARVANNNRLPLLDLGAAAGYNSRGGSYLSAARDLRERDGHLWQVDLTLSFPWGNRDANARYRTALASLNREQLRLQQIEQAILVQVRGAVRSVDTNRESLRISSLATQLSQRQHELEMARLAEGLSTSRRVLEAQEDLDTARVNELQARVALRQAVSDLRRLEGSAWQTYRIELPAAGGGRGESQAR